MVSIRRTLRSLNRYAHLNSTIGIQTDTLLYIFKNNANLIVSQQVNFVFITSITFGVRSLCMSTKHSQDCRAIMPQLNLCKQKRMRNVIRVAFSK